MTTDSANRAEYFMVPYPPQPSVVAEQSHAAVYDEARCPDCLGAVQHNRADPTAWRVLHDECCPRWSELERQQRVQQEAEEREAARAERLAARRKRRPKPEGDSRG